MNTLRKFQEERIIGYNLSRFLKEHTISVEDLAERLSCETIKLKELLTGSVAVNEDFLCAIAEELGIQAEDLKMIPDADELSHYNVHYMGKAADAQSMNRLLDKVDFYIRLLNADKSR